MARDIGEGCRGNTVSFEDVIAARDVPSTDIHATHSAAILEGSGLAHAVMQAARGQGAFGGRLDERTSRFGRGLLKPVDRASPGRLRRLR
jgi:hypothetical protein